MKTKILSAALLFVLVVLFSCNKNHTCFDGEQNQFEIGIDCCGPCDSICAGLQNCFVVANVETCNDGVQNQDETGVDCGGVCPACITPDNPFLRATIDGALWEAETVQAVSTVPGSLVITGSKADGTSITLTYLGNFEVAVFDLTLGNSGTYTDENSDVCSSIDGTGGQIGFTSFDTVNNVVAGNFNFNCDSAGSPHSLTSGEFGDISY